MPGAIWPPGRCAVGWLLLRCSTDLTPQRCPSFSFKEETLAHACKSKLRMRSPAQGSQDYFQLLLCIPMRAPPPSRPATSAFRTRCSSMPRQPPLGSLTRSGQPGKGCPPPPEPLSRTSAFHPFCLRRRVALPFRLGGFQIHSPSRSTLTSTPCPPSTPGTYRGSPAEEAAASAGAAQAGGGGAGPIPAAACEGGSGAPSPGRLLRAGRSGAERSLPQVVPQAAAVPRAPGSKPSAPNPQLRAPTPGPAAPGAGALSPAGRAGEAEVGARPLPLSTQTSPTQAAAPLSFFPPF